MRQPTAAADFPRLVQAIRELAQAASSHVVSDCYIHSALAAAILEKLGVKAQVTAGWAGWRVGDGDSDVILHAPSPGLVPAGGFPYHVWLEVDHLIFDATPIKEPIMEMTDQEVRNIMCLPSVDEIFPLVFDNGSKVDGLTAHCAKCGKEVPSGDLHATLTRTQFNAALAGHALCFSCHTATPFEARIRNDGTVLHRKNGGWREDRYDTGRGRRSGGRLIGLLRRLWKA